MLARVTKTEVPPEEISGSGIPLVGTSASTTLMLKKACSRIAVVMPKAVRRAKESLERNAGAQPAHAQHYKESNNKDGADQAQLFGDVGEDEIS